MNTATILIVEDDPSLISLLKQNLHFEGYQVLEARTGTEGLRIAETAEPDLIILDLMLPKMSGIQLCKQVRSTGNKVPILMLSAKGETHDKIKGLRTGADDYLTKPFDLLELLARIEALLRRIPQINTYKDSYQLGELFINFTNNSIQKEGQHIALTRQESVLLQYLVHHEGELLSREQIIKEVWGHDYLYSNRTVDTHITKLRKKIEAIPSNPRHIQTVHRVGYKFVK